MPLEITKMAKDAMPDALFGQLVDRINQETSSAEKKVEILYGSRGFFNASQASTLLFLYANPPDRVRVIKILEPRLCRMSCQDARQIIGAVTVQNDKLIVLDCIKRVLTDSQTKLGEEYILSAFPFECDKFKAIHILNTVSSFVGENVAAGGHQGYAALGGLYTQARPMVPHLYGDVNYQAQQIPGQGQVQIAPQAQPGVVPSIYTGHPSYAYPPDMSYIKDRGYPGAAEHPVCESNIKPYPAGAPPLSYHSGAPNPTGFTTMA
ncbi:uncharacterized protein LOC123549037 [Mercenaria mercenaria]|uniref:uncharacterized protein LOC123549037 n=1 Tax=Mercenaria mercenaria TaxID=6596 RepID=UPI00234F154C|nr:uncharacterized protein LOC123549037 [Mercenaria mercenaria]